MALPVGVQTCEVTFGPFTDFQGNPVRGRVSFKPSRSLIWVATGVPILASVITVSLDENGAGSVYLPYTDQPGFADGAGHSVTNWTYLATFALAGDVDAPSPTYFQLPTGPAQIDLDLATPMGASNGTLVDMPAVLSVNGQTGHVVVTGTGGGSGSSTLAGINDMAADGRTLLANPNTYADMRNLLGVPPKNNSALTGSTTAQTLSLSGDLTVAGAVTLPAGSLAQSFIANLATDLAAKASNSSVSSLSATVAQKANTSNPTFTGTVTTPNLTVSGAVSLPTNSLTISMVNGLTAALNSNLSPVDAYCPGNAQITRPITDPNRRVIWFKSTAPAGGGYPNAEPRDSWVIWDG